MKVLLGICGLLAVILLAAFSLKYNTTSSTAKTTNQTRSKRKSHQLKLIGNTKKRPTNFDYKNRVNGIAVYSGMDMSFASQSNVDRFQQDHRSLVDHVAQHERLTEMLNEKNVVQNQELKGHEAKIKAKSALQQRHIDFEILEQQRKTDKIRLLTEERIKAAEEAAFQRVKQMHQKLGNPVLPEVSSTTQPSNEVIKNQK